jgi:hypothetical protein
VDHFDLITGTSTGGIIALGLGLGLSAAEIRDFYRQHGQTIFPSTSLVGRLGRVRQLFRPKCSHAALRQALAKILKDQKFGESRCRLVIPTYDGIRGRLFLLKTAHHPQFQHDYQALAVDVALATSAAPTYFAAAPFPEHHGSSYVDGGVWANCPALVGILEAFHFLKVPLDQIDVLSVGTTTTLFSIAQHANSGIAQWNAGLINLMFNGQVEAALAQARLLLDGRLHRIDVTVKDGEYSLDDARPAKIDRLINLGDSEGKKVGNKNVVQARFLNGQPAPPFNPVYAV